MFTHHKTSIRIRDAAFDGTDLEAEPGLREAVLARALCASKAADRERITQRIRDINDTPLLRLLDRLGDRDYVDEPKRITADCVEILEPDPTLCAVVFAYYVDRFSYGSRDAERYIAEHGTPERLRAMLPALIWSGGGHEAYLSITPPWPAATLDWIAALDVPVTGFALTLAEPAALPAALAEKKELRSIRTSGAPLSIAEGVLPRLEALTSLRGTLASVPSELGRAVGLETLHIRGDFTTLPDLSALTHLTKLTVIAPLEHLGTLPPSIEELSLTGLKCPVPSSLGELPALRQVFLGDLHLETFPAGWLGRSGLLLSHARITVGDALGGAARRALGLPGTDSLTDALHFFLVDLLEGLLPVPEPGGVATPEVLVAVSRTYIDVEHGADSNNFYARQIRDLGGPVEVAANEALEDIPCIRDEVMLATALHRLEAVEDFDRDAFATTVRTILESARHRSRVADWT